jgi:ribosomal protein S18 acetylase RimI-like enzyme
MPEQTPEVSLQASARERDSVAKAGTEAAAEMARALALAFHDDPVFSWVLRHDARRMCPLERGFELFLRRVWLEHEEVYTTAGTAGVAVWEPPQQWKLSAPRQLRLLPAMLGVFQRHLPRVVAALQKLEARHPREPHYYLPFIGVRPQWQGRGLGAALLRPVLERCDEQRMPAFLEASTPRNRALYERHGFAVMEEFRLGRSAPRQWRMWREPAGTAAPT